MEMEGSPVQVTWEKFQQEKPMIQVSNLGQLSRFKNRCRSSHLAGCMEGSSEALGVQSVSSYIPLDTYHSCKIDLPVQMRQKGSSVTFSKEEIRFLCTQMHSACEFGQCLLGFGTSFGKEMASSCCSRPGQLPAALATLAKMLAGWFPRFAMLLP